MRDRGGAEFERAGLELWRPPLRSSKASDPHLATSGVADEGCSNLLARLSCSTGSPLHSSHLNLPEGPPPPMTLKNDEVFSPCPSFLLPGCYPESNNVPTSAPPTYPDVQYLLFVPSLLVLCPTLPVLQALAFPACPRLRAPPPWRPQLGITISSEGLSAALALPLCPHSLYPFLMSLRQNYLQPICSPTPTPDSS